MSSKHEVSFIYLINKNLFAIQTARFDVGKKPFAGDPWWCAWRLGTVRGIGIPYEAS